MKNTELNVAFVIEGINTELQVFLPAQAVFDRFLLKYPLAQRAYPMRLSKHMLPASA